MNEPVFERVEAVLAALRGVMDALGVSAPDDPTIAAALEELHAASAAVGDPARLRAQVPAAEHDRLRRALEDWMRMNALVSAMVARDRERLEERFERARDGRRSLDALRPVDGTTGRSCDLSA